ncbi:polyprenyl synthetase family protein [Streptomyces sp. NPDC005423]|uniref:polyprenyl synthetase family protein n=1 Tax=Streptomyces sp. NPDC005423 TaxID=3155343 RepID=UPI0033B56BC5
MLTPPVPVLTWRTADGDSSAAIPPAVWLERVEAEARAGVEAACQENPGLLPSGLSGLLDRYPGSVPARLFGILVAGALGGQPEDAMPVVAVSRLWWAGAQALDDLADSPGVSAPLTPHQLSTAENAPSPAQDAARLVLLAMACGTLVPFAIIDRRQLPPEITGFWRRTLLRTSLRATAGQLADLASFDGPFTWAQAIKTYRGKTGAPYGRDAVMAARLSTADPMSLRAWHAFGELFGLLRQVANDAAHRGSGRDEDLSNGTVTLLLAHALEKAEPGARRHLLWLHTHARHDPEARTELSAALRQPGIEADYADRVGVLRQQACALLDRLAPASSHRDLLHHLMHGSERSAVGSMT